MVSSKRGAFYGGALSALIVIVAALAQPKPIKPNVKPRGAGGEIHGVVLFTGAERVALTNVPATNFRTVIAIPDFKLFLRDGAGSTVATTTTNLSGYYRFGWQPPGTYHVCWNGAGWVAGCYPDPIVIVSNTKYPTAIRARGVAPVSGRVALADGGSPWTFDEYFGIERTARINVLAGKTRILSVRANVAGQYVIPNVPHTATTVAAELEAINGSQALAGRSSGVNFTLRNRAPVVRYVVARRSAGGVLDVDPGETLDVEASAIDPDGDAIQYDWKSGPASGAISGSGPHAKWVIPNEPGAYTVYVVARDGKGGYAMRTATVNAGPPATRFSGQVVSQAGGTAVSGAAVAVNGSAATTNADGSFTLTAPRANRYVLDISKPGFALFSRIFNHGQYGRYSLVPAQVTTVDPTKAIDITDGRQTIERRKIGPVRFHLDPNSLVDAEGNVATGMLRDAVATLDITNAEMPGDYGAMQGGSETNLISFGAAFNEFTDASGRRYNLAPGKTAKMILPVPAAMRPHAPPQITLWSYDERTGYWNDDEGTATYDAAQGAYVGEVRHFSVVNTDLSKTTAACLGVTLDASIPANQVRVRVSYVSGPNPFAQTPELLLDATLNAIWRLPPDDVIKLDGLDPTTSTVMNNMTVLDNGTTPAAGNTFNIGPATTPLWPNPPTPCHQVTVRLDVPNPQGFPNSPFFTRAGPGTDANAIGYYQAVNPGATYNGTTWSGGSRSTLGAWWSAAGFDPTTGAGGTRASYLNFNDLGFGRDMHIRQTANGDVFAYVTNYGGSDQNPLNADYAQNQDLAHQLATVCMETTSLPGVTGRVTKFFVYNGGGPTAPLVNSADLDGHGQKFVPNLCENCHGGRFYNPANAAAPTAQEVSLRSGVGTIGSSFREFDLHTYRFPGGSATPAPAVLPDFYQLNQLVKNSGPQQAIVDLIDGWYAASTTVQDTTYYPQPGWTAHPDLYHQVVAESCRTCHIAFGSDQNQGLNWNTYSQMQQENAGGLIGFSVCSGRYMPHAQITYRNFWLSTGPHRPSVLASFAAADWTTIGTCP